MHNNDTDAPEVVPSLAAMLPTYPVSAVPFLLTQHND